MENQILPVLHTRQSCSHRAHESGLGPQKQASLEDSITEFSNSSPRRENNTERKPLPSPIPSQEPPVASTLKDPLQAAGPMADFYAALTPLKTINQEVPQHLIASPGGVIA